MKDVLDENIDNIPKRLCLKCGRCSKGYPESYWDELPLGCGFEGWAFQKREEVKQKIRKQKEELVSLEIALKKADFYQAGIILRNIEEIKDNIKIYSKYGSENW